MSCLSVTLRDLEKAMRIFYTITAFFLVVKLTSVFLTNLLQISCYGNKKYHKELDRHINIDGQRLYYTLSRQKLTNGFYDMRVHCYAEASKSIREALIKFLEIRHPQLLPNILKVLTQHLIIFSVSKIWKFHKWNFFQMMFFLYVYHIFLACLFVLPCVNTPRTY